MSFCEFCHYFEFVESHEVYILRVDRERMSCLIICKDQFIELISPILVNYTQFDRAMRCFKCWIDKRSIKHLLVNGIRLVNVVLDVASYDIRVDVYIRDRAWVN